MQLKLVLVLVLACLAVLFVVQNVTLVEVRFLGWSVTMTLSLLIFLLFATGVITGSLLQSYWRYRRKPPPDTERMGERQP
ncbi:MAG TPA: LapA family protein [Burkholderiales bacterium]|nr:LapA family protein [Burkholderiales bacterium]